MESLVKNKAKGKTRKEALAPSETVKATDDQLQAALKYVMKRHRKALEILAKH